MQFKGHPFDLDVFAFGGLFQRRLRQKAPRSDVVGENQDRHRHSSAQQDDRDVEQLAWFQINCIPEPRASWVCAAGIIVALPSAAA